MATHHITQKKRSRNIVVVILKRLCDRFTYRLVACEMDDRINILILKNAVHTFPVKHIDLIEFHFFPCNLLYSLKRFFIGIVEIIHYYDFIAVVQQFHTCVASDIACSTGY